MTNRLLSVAGFSLGAATMVAAVSVARAIWLRNRAIDLGDILSSQWGRP